MKNGQIKPFSRRDFLKLAGLSLLGLGIEPMLSSCSRTPAPTPFPPPTSATPAPTFTNTLQPPTGTPTSTATPEPTSPFSDGDLTATAEFSALPPRDQARLRLIEKYGTATKALPLEFHGDYYWMYEGAYNMDPPTFVWMMEWFQKNDVWSVNGEELVGFLEGTIQLPARSVVLTTDSGNTSLESLQRMTPVLQRTNMHFISLIWTMQMLPEETARCPENICWDSFNEALDSGMFTFGTHSEYHLEFTDFDLEWGLNDLLGSKEEIETNLGVEVELISWPSEACPVWMDKLEDYGFKAAFGGRSRPIKECSVFYQDPMRWCLPRLFPPNRDTLISGRPDGMTLGEMMINFSDGF